MSHQFRIQAATSGHRQPSTARSQAGQLVVHLRKFTEQLLSLQLKIEVRKVGNARIDRVITGGFDGGQPSLAFFVGALLSWTPLAGTAFVVAEEVFLTALGGDLLGGTLGRGSA